MKGGQVLANRHNNYIINSKLKFQNIQETQLPTREGFVINVLPANERTKTADKNKCKCQKRLLNNSAKLLN